MGTSNHMKFLPHPHFRRPGVDPQQNGIDDSFTHEQYTLMNNYLVEMIATKKDNRRYILTKLVLDLLYAATGRSDESLMLRLCDFGRPEIQPNVGPCAGELHKLAVFMGKSGTANPELMPLMPHTNIDLCALFAISTYLHHTYATMKEKFPDPELHYDDEWCVGPMGIWLGVWELERKC